MVMGSDCSLPFRVNFAVEVAKVDAITKTGDKNFRTRFQIFLRKLKHLIDLFQPLRQSNSSIPETFVFNSVMGARSHII